MIDTIMLFAAGRGSRMRHLSESKPKTLVKILDRPILFHTLDLMQSYPFKNIFINTHHLHEQMQDAIAQYKKQNPKCPEITVFYEEELLETGGTIKDVFGRLGHNHSPIFTLNTDTIIKSRSCIFSHMNKVWDTSRMDFLMFLQPFDKAIGYRGKGDFELLPDGKIYRPEQERNYSYMFAGLQILKPEIIVQNNMRVFSLSEYFFNNERMYGTSLKGAKWYHVNTPEDIVDVEIDLLAYDRKQVRQLNYGS